MGERKNKESIANGEKATTLHEENFVMSLEKNFLKVLTLIWNNFLGDLVSS